MKDDPLAAAAAPLRAPILEALGWRYVGAPDMKDVAWACWVKPGGDDWHQQEPPDPTKDLNTMFLAQALLTENQWDGFIEYLGETDPDCARNGLTYAISGIGASCARRAIAFVKAHALPKTFDRGEP